SGRLAEMQVPRRRQNPQNQKAQSQRARQRHVDAEEQRRREEPAHRRGCRRPRGRRFVGDGLHVLVSWIAEAGCDSHESLCTFGWRGVLKAVGRADGRVSKEGEGPERQGGVKMTAPSRTIVASLQNTIIKANDYQHPHREATASSRTMKVALDI